MSERLDAVVAREYTDRDGNKKTQWTKIGSAWPRRDGGWSISLEALPLPAMGERGLETRIMLMQPKRDRAPADAHPSQFKTEQSKYSSDLDDEDLPF